MIFRVLLIVLFLQSIALSSTTVQITVINGVVTDAESGDTLPGVHVFIAGTTLGSSSNADGSFEFETTLSGRQELVSSFIGYSSNVRSLNLGSRDTLFLKIELVPDVIKLGEIRVIASNNEFLKNLDQFKRFFIGFDSNADQTFIKNAEILNFEDGENARITVSANAPLIIENLALGYQYEVEIQQAYFYPKDNTGFYKIYPRVIELSAPNRRTQRRWNANRRDSYDGSSRHFFSSLTQDKLRRNKFSVYPNESIFINYSDSLDHLKQWYPSNWKYIKENFHVFLFQNEASRIEYTENRATRVAQEYFEPEISSLRVSGFPETIVVNEDGILLNSDNIQLFGVWSDTRFSNFLPLDYKR